MKRFLQFSGLLLFAAMLVGCAASSSSIITDYDQDVSFDSYKTYYWANEFDTNKNDSDKPLFYNTLIQKRLKDAIREEMTVRGYTLDEENPDLLVNVSVQTKNNQESRTTSTSYPIGGVGGFSPFYPGFGNNFGYMYGFQGTQRTETKIHMVGGLVLELIDRDKRQLVWQGYAPEVLHTDTEDKREELKKAVDQIFNEYDQRFNNEDD